MNRQLWNVGFRFKDSWWNIAHASISTDNIIKILHNPSWKLCMTSPKTATMETRVTQLKKKSTWESELSQDNYIKHWNVTLGIIEHFSAQPEHEIKANYKKLVSFKYRER